MRIFLAILALMLVLSPARAASDAALREVRFDQNLNRRISLDAPFLDESGRSVTLANYCNGQKPVLLVMGYYGCPMLCTLVANGLVESLHDLRSDIGKDFTVLHISIDSHEGPREAATKKATYLKRYGRLGAADGWHFLTGNIASIERVASDVGFHYLYDTETKQYAHPSGFVVLTPEGRIARYFFGVNFSPHEMHAALVDAGRNRIGAAVEQVFLLCFHYNPITGKYSFAILSLLRICGVATVLAIGCFIVVSARRRLSSQQQ